MESIERCKSNKARLISAILLLSLALVPQISAQQQEPSAPPPSRQQTPKKSDRTADQDDKDKPGEVQGKTKLERETGTVNDRILAVMPNYGTVEKADKLPPITSGQKFKLATAGVFDYFTFPFIGGLAAIDQANNSPKSWGQGWGAYGKRYGASFADNGIGTYMTTAIFPSMLREDPRYYQLGKGMGRLFITRTDSGHNRFNYSETFGNAAAAGLSNIYHAPEDRTLSRNLETWGMLDMWDGVSNLMKEFWTDIRRKVFHKNNP
jgi:hypothetical protein